MTSAPKARVAALKGGRRRPLREAAGDAAQGGGGAGADHQHPAGAADHRGAHEQGIGGICQIGARRPVGGEFFHRIGFTGQQPLVHEQVAGIEDAAVSRHQVARRQQHDIAGYQFDDRKQIAEMVGELDERRVLGARAHLVGADAALSPARCRFL
ncbi:MAG: hypothetical protein IPP18_15610 [Rhodocyclaceae bacterium]|nr:hypothetical protein [Rhodocyclaceae bacterium]